MRRVKLGLVEIGWLPPSCLVRVALGERHLWARWGDGRLTAIGLDLDDLLGCDLEEIRRRLSAGTGQELQPADVELLAPVESQEVWAAGVTYARSREARMEESELKDVYARVYEAARPELFFKAAGWRVVGSGGDVAIRRDSTWDVPEPELAVLCNSGGEVVAFSCGNDMSSRSIEGENPLYLPQAKVYDRSCSLGPGAALAWEVDLQGASVRLDIERAGARIFSGEVSLEQMVRKPSELVRSLLSSYTCPAGLWLLTGTGIVPDTPYTAEEEDVVSVTIDGLGALVNRVTKLPEASTVG